jgi:hypothetical protein
MIERAVRAHLIATAGVQTLVADRVYSFRKPQGAATPYIVFQRISGERLHTLDGPTGRAHPRIQIDAYATTYPAARAIADAVRAALDGFKGDVAVDAESPPTSLKIVYAALQDDRDFVEDDIDPVLYRVSSDYFVTYQEN